SRVVVRLQSLPLCFDFQPDGAMLVVSSAQRRLLRLTAGGDLVEHAGLEPLSRAGANDIVVDGRGNAYVNSHDAPMGTTGADGEKATGGVYLVPAVALAPHGAGDLDSPHGMAITPDNAPRVGAESYRHRLAAFAIDRDGDLGERR